MFDTLPIEVAEPAGAAAESATPGPVVSAQDAALWAAEWADVSGAVLAKLIADGMASLAQIPDNLAGDQQIFDLVTANTRLAGWAAANQARLTALVHGRALAEHQGFGLVQRDGHGAGAGPSHGFDDQAYTTSEIAANLAMALGQSMPAAGKDVAFALGLARDVEVLQALAVGRMDTPQARAVVEELTQVLDPGVRGPVVAALTTHPESPGADQVLVRELRGGRGRLWDLSPGQLRAIIRRETQTRDPASAQTPAERARRERHVRFHPRPDAMAELVLSGPAETLAAVHQHLSHAAQAVQQHHATHRDHDALESGPASLGELRHDIAVGWLTNGEHGLAVSYRPDPAERVDPAGPAGPARPAGQGVVLPRPPHITVNITVAESTLLGLDQLPATLHTPSGPMPIPADLAQALAYQPDQATWRRILCDPATGVATDVSRTYQPAPRIAEYVKIRDGHTSRFPAASTTTRIELDHVDRYRFNDIHGPRDGNDDLDQTTSANLGSAGLREHHLKTDGAIQVTGNANGPLTYRGRTGRDHISWPHQYREPERDDPPPRRSRLEPDHGDPPY